MRQENEVSLKGDPVSTHGRNLSRTECSRNLDRDKPNLRQVKRDLKQAGNCKRRRHLQRNMTDHPEKATQTEFNFGWRSTTGLNARLTAVRSTQTQADAPATNTWQQTEAGHSAAEYGSDVGSRANDLAVRKR